MRMPTSVRQGIRFRISPKRPLLMVKVQINDRGPFDFVLDTGASLSVITPATAEAAGVRASGENPTAIGAGGRIKAGLTKIESLTLGACTARNLQVALMDLDGVGKPLGIRLGGLIGYNFLRNYAVTIDYPARQLFLKPARRQDVKTARR
jgi:predicted aspartyl protease